MKFFVTTIIYHHPDDGILAVSNTRCAETETLALQKFRQDNYNELEKTGYVFLSSQAGEVTDDKLAGYLRLKGYGVTEPSSDID